MIDMERCGGRETYKKMQLVTRLWLDECEEGTTESVTLIARATQRISLLAILSSVNQVNHVGQARPSIFVANFSRWID